MLLDDGFPPGQQVQDSAQSLGTSSVHQQKGTVSKRELEQEVIVIEDTPLSMRRLTPEPARRRSESSSPPSPAKTTAAKFEMYDKAESTLSLTTTNSDMEEDIAEITLKRHISQLNDQ